ncbi:MAG: SCP2 sterol-binding domain-containing protein [Acidimicrobiales bacterium]
MPHPFLSDEWIAEAHAIRAEYRGRAQPIPHAVRMNLVVTEMPSETGDLAAHLDTTTGELDLDKGHLDQADLEVTVDYDTARAILVDGNGQAGMQAYMMGKIRVMGDLTKLMALQTLPPDGASREMAERLRAITG